MKTYENIKALRLKLNISQDELAKKVGYTDRSSIAKVESGKVDLTESKIRAFANVLGVSVMELMGLEPSAKSSALTESEVKLIDNYRNATEEIREAAGTILHLSAERNRG